MKKYLSSLYNEFKKIFVDAIVNELKVKGNKIEFSPYIRINLPNEEEEFEEITEIEFDVDENTWYVHNYVTCTDLMTNEYWTPLKDFSFDELYQIAERL